MSSRKYIRYVTREKLEKVANENKHYVSCYFTYKSLSESSQLSYLSDFNQWLVFLHDRVEKGIVAEEDILKCLNAENGIDRMISLIEDFISFCIVELGNNERRIQRRLSSMSSFFLYLLKERKIRSNPLDYIERQTK
ncbi:hypothetical protein PAAL66ix_21824 [Paenibacillus alvei A6-6i-x]|nr:hypothetical protein PAAL66ix_21824 [Paenibacillus alvei A6-6i-x]